MNLSYFYPSIYWKTACLCVDAGAINPEDFYNLINSGILDVTDEEDAREQNKVKYGEIAKAIIKFRQYGNVDLPDINTSRFGFTPDENRNTIVYGLRGISRIGEQIIKDIIINQPYSSVENFVKKMTTTDGKKLISKDKIVNLIKAGAFDNIENKPREEILKNYIMSVADQKKKLNLMNFQMLVKYNLIPTELDFNIKIFNFTKYIRKMKFMENYILDDVALEFYTNNFGTTKVRTTIKDGKEICIIDAKYWENIYDNAMNKPRDFIKQNHDDLLHKLNTILFEEEYNKYAIGDIAQWELDSLSFYYTKHPLQDTEMPIEISRVSDLIENEFDGFWIIKGKQVPKFKLRTIVGTVVDKDKTKGLVTLQTPYDEVIDLKIFKQQFARFTHIISNIDEDGNKDILEDSFFEKGTNLMVTGILRGEIFIPKVYKDTGFEAILKIILNDQGQVDYLLRKAQ